MIMNYVLILKIKLNMACNFFDERIVITVVCLWSLSIFGVILNFSFSNIFVFGPSESLQIFNIHINTWLKWSMVATYIVINQCIETYGLNTISPWLINDIQNRNVMTIKYSKLTTQLILLFWNIYLWLSYLVSLRLYFTQFDFLLLLLIMDCSMSLITTHHYIKVKKRFMFSFYESM